MTYNSNHIEGNRLTHNQTYIFETNTIRIDNSIVNIDDIIETVNHFRCIDMIIDKAKVELTEKFFKELHYTLKYNTSDFTKDWFKAGDYKLLANEVGNIKTTKPEEVHHYIKILLDKYKSKNKATFDDILDFHVQFERIHLFLDGNGRVGRLIMFKESLKK